MGYVCIRFVCDTRSLRFLLFLYVTIVLIIFLPRSQDPLCCLCTSMGYPTSSIRSVVLGLCMCTCVHIPTCLFSWYICYCYDRGPLLHLSPDLLLSQFCLLPFFTGNKNRSSAVCSVTKERSYTHIYQNSNTIKTICGLMREITNRISISR